MKRSVLTVLTLLAGLLAWPAHAQLVVVDPANLVQNVLQAARSLQQIENQIQQLQNEAQMLINEAKNLEHLDINTLNRLLVGIATTQQLLNQAQGMTFLIAQTQNTFLRLYPDAYGPGASRDQMNADALERWSDSRLALDTTVQMQAQATQNFAADQQVLQDLITASQGSDGILQATQASNQLLALQSRQTIQAQQLQIAQERSAALERARAVAAEARSRELRRRFLTDGANYNPDPVTIFP